MAGLWGDTLTRIMRPRSRMTGTEWADTRRYIAPGTSPEPGEWRTSRVPYLAEPMNCATDSSTEISVLMCSSQIAKSEFLLNVMGYYADQEPAPQLMLQPTLEGAEAFSKERIDPTFRYSEGLKGKLSEGKEGRGTARKSSTTIRMKHYEGGYLALVGANSPAGLASRPIRILLADEVDRYGTTKEGDPLKLAIQRTTNFHNRKICLVSTPTIDGQSKIQEWWNKSDQRRYHVPCPCCGTAQVLKWAQVKWDKDENGSHLPGTARYECEACGGRMRGPGKPSPEMLQAGYWVKGNPASKIAGFHVNSLYSPWVDLVELVEEWVEARKNRDRKGLMEFINLKLGEPWKDEADDLDYELLHRTRREYYAGEVPEQALLLTVGADTQDHYIAAECVGWAKGKESYGVEYQIFYGNTLEDDVWLRFDEWLQRERTRADGTKMHVVATFVDSGGHRTDNVYKFCAARENRRVYAIKGRSGDVPMIAKPARNNRWGAPRIDLGVDALKSATLHAVSIQEEGPNYCHWSRAAEAGYDVDYFKGLLSERLEYKFDKAKGKSAVAWSKVHERNEPLDCRNYATAAMEMLNPNWEALEAKLSAAGGVPPPHVARPRRRAGVLSRGV